MVLSQQQQRRNQTQTKPNNAGKSSTACGRNHEDHRMKQKSAPVHSNAMTQTSEVPSQKPRQQPMTTVLPSPTSSNSNAFHWSLATSAGLGRHKLPVSNCCLNASEKVHTACQAVESSALSLHSLVECLRTLPNQQSLVAERDFNSNPNKQQRQGRCPVRPIGTSSPVAKDINKNSVPDITNELAMLLDKVRELRCAAVEADRELLTLRAENAQLRRLQQSAANSLSTRRSADSNSLPLSLIQPAVFQYEQQKQQVIPSPTVVSSPPQTSLVSTTSSPLAKYPNLRNLLMPVTSSLLAEQEQLHVVAPSPQISSNCCDQMPSVQTTCQSSSNLVTQSPFYSALQSADDGLVRLRRHLASVQSTSSSSFINSSQ